MNPLHPTTLLAGTFLLVAPAQGFVYFTDPLRAGSMTDNSGTLFLGIDEEKITIDIQISGTTTDSTITGRSFELEVGGQVINSGISSGTVIGYSGCAPTHLTTGRSIHIGEGLLSAFTPTTDEVVNTTCDAHFEDTRYSWELPSSPEIEAAAKDAFFYQVKLHRKNEDSTSESSTIDNLFTLEFGGVEFTAVPEPSTCLFLSLGLASSFFRRKR